MRLWAQGHAHAEFVVGFGGLDCTDNSIIFVASGIYMGREDLQAARGTHRNPILVDACST